MTDNDEAEELLNDDEFPENGLKSALIMHLIAAGHIMLAGGTVCNFLIHPSVKTSQHSSFANKIGNYLNEICHSYDEKETYEAFEAAYKSLKDTKRDIFPLDKIYGYIINVNNLTQSTTTYSVSFNWHGIPCAFLYS